MALLRLLARLGLDTSNFETGLKRAESLTDKFGSKVQKDIGKAFGKAFGVTAVAATTVALATRVSRSVDEIKKLAKETSLTTDEVQMIQAAANDAGVSFDEMSKRVASGSENIEKFRKSVIFTRDDIENIKQFNNALADVGNFWTGVAGKIISGATDIFDTLSNPDAAYFEQLRRNEQKELDRQHQLRRRNTDPSLIDGTAEYKQVQALNAMVFAAQKMRFSKMDNAGKVVELERQISELEIKLESDTFRSFDPTEQARGERLRRDQIAHEIERKRMEIELTKLLPQDAVKAAAQKATPLNNTFDSLARIGGFTGRPDNQSFTIQERIARATEQTARNTDPSFGGVF